MPKYFLLTGATGLVGRYLLRDLLNAESRLAVLIRPQRNRSARQRLQAILDHWREAEGIDLPEPVCLSGDISLPHLGLNKEDRQWITKHVDQIIHNAASLTFYGKDRSEEPWKSNLTGTSHVLEICREVGISQMHYVSTAYVCGSRLGTIYESDPLDQNQEFRNDYEEAKRDAELLVHQADFLDRLTIYRPATIVGDSQTGYTSTYHAFYAYLQFAWVIGNYSDKDENGRWHAPLRLNASGKEHRNLVPIDWISSVMSVLLLDSSFHGQTYHLTPNKPVTVVEIEEAMSEYFRYYGPTFVGVNGLDGKELNDLERLFYQNLSTYQPYWTGEPTFDSTNTTKALPNLPCPVITQEMFSRLIDFAVQDRWGKGKPAPRVEAQTGT